MKPIPLNEYEKLSDEKLAETKHKLRKDLTETPAGFGERAGNIGSGVFKGSIAGSAAYVVGHIIQNKDMWHEAVQEAEKSGNTMAELGEKILHGHMQEAGMRALGTYGETLFKGSKKIGFAAGAVVATGTTILAARQSWKKSSNDVANNANTALTHIERIERERHEQKTAANQPQPGGTPG
jgi:hypothetical protein